METFGERVKKERRRKGICVTDFAEKIGVTSDAVMKIESGKRGQAFARLPKIARALGCSIDDLFPEMDKPEEETNVSEDKTVCADGFADDGDDFDGWEL